MLTLFTIIGGHEIIGKLHQAAANVLRVEHPLVIRPVQRAPNDFVLDFFPHSLANPEGVHEFNTSAIVSISTEMPTELEKAYTERTTNIILSSALDDLERMS